MEFINDYLKDSAKVIEMMNREDIAKTIELIEDVRNRRGRIFFLGVGGGAGHASHAVNDFRKIAGIESYAVTDNASELTARVNDEGWESCYADWLKQSNLNDNDLIFIFSVGGGSLSHNLSVNIIKALEYGKAVGTAVIGIVGRDGGYTARVADACVIVPNPNPKTTTAITESMQALVWHLIVSHPKLYVNEMRWESTEEFN